MKKLIVMAAILAITGFSTTPPAIAKSKRITADIARRLYTLIVIIYCFTLPGYALYWR